MSDTTLYSSGDYVVLSTNDPYVNVSSFTGVLEDVINEGTGTLFQKQFRYSLDQETYSEYVSLTLENLGTVKLSPNGSTYLQFRYTLLSGGPATVKSVSLQTTTYPADPYTGFVPANKQDETRVYAYPLSYKTGAKWNPYKMNRAVRLFKDLNLMVNSLFGHEVQYYRALPKGRSKDVFLLEYSLYEHEDKQCIQVVVPNNQFPDNKFNMGPFGVDFDLPFEIQIDKDYFQAIFGEGSGPQKRDVLYFPRTNRIYEISSSYLFRDFMNEPLYFKVNLQKWSPKANADMSEDLAKLENLTVSVEKLFGENQKVEEINIANPSQFQQTTTVSDPVRSYLFETIDIIEAPVMNYYLSISEYQYLLKSTVNENMASVGLTAGNFSLLKNEQTYYARFNRNSSQPNESYLYSMKKLIYKGENIEGKSVFEFKSGDSPIASISKKYEIFGPTSQYVLYENEYSSGATTEIPLFTCNINSVSRSFQENVIEYEALGEFTTLQDKACSAWFKVKKNERFSTSVISMNNDALTLDITYSAPHNFFIGDYISLRRTSGGNFNVVGEVVKIYSENRLEIIVGEPILNHVNVVFPSWKSYSDLKIQLTHPKVMMSSLKNQKGIKIELLEKRYFRLHLNEKVYFFILSNTTPDLTEDKWYSFVISMSNLFTQLTFNLWEMQWNSQTNLPATSDLRLIYGKTETDFPKIDRSSTANYHIVSSDIELTNIRVWTQTIETDKQSLILNQNIVKDASKAIVIDNAIPRSRLPYISYTH